MEFGNAGVAKEAEDVPLLSAQRGMDCENPLDEPATRLRMRPVVAEHTDPRKFEQPDFPSRTSQAD